MSKFLYFFFIISVEMSIEISVKPYRALEILEEEAKKNKSSRISWK